ncbi:MAG TPA: peptide ABC transporter substrate-binding protein [Rhizomicrobium sp.]|jgi:oligopeptide transport system substrate-binding protein|nr:peptide ABC transporter substrate-binding protein [Rhizomicrobium sp.]
MTASRMLALAALVLLAACSRSGGGNQTVHAPDYLVRGNGAEIKSLDPHYIDGNWEANVVGDMLVGLTTDAPNGEPMPGAATSWETSPDGKSWIFHLRDHVWSDGQPVTAEDFVYAWRRILEPARGAPYAYYLWLVKNAQAISAGKLPTSALGVTAKDDKTLVVQLEHPAPYMLEYLLHQAVFPVPRHVVMAKGNDWARPENYVANGPYLPKEWVPNDHITLVKNPRFYDAANVRLQTIIYKPTSDTLAALKAIRAGELDTQNLVPGAEISWMRSHIPHTLQLNTTLGVAYLSLNFTRKPFQDARMRQVIALVYEREIITQRILKLGEPAAYHFVPPGTANYPGGAQMWFRALPYEQRIARARKLMAEMGYGPDNHFHSTYDATTTPDAKRTAASLQALLRRVYIDVDIVPSDTQVYYKKLQQGQFDIASGSWIGDFNDPGTFLDLLRTGSGNNYGQYSNPRFDALMDRANQMLDIKARGELLRQAEQTALDDLAVIPTRFLVTQDIVEPYVKGWIPNIRDFNRSRWLWIDPHARPERGE